VEKVNNDDRTSKSIAPKAQRDLTPTPAKASEQCSRVSPKHHKDQSKPPTSVGTANQLIQSDGSAKADLVVSTRAKDFKRTPQNQAGPLEREKAYRNLKRLAPNPKLED